MSTRDESLDGAIGRRVGEAIGVGAQAEEVGRVCWQAGQYSFTNIAGKAGAWRRRGVDFVAKLRGRPPLELAEDGVAIRVRVTAQRGRVVGDQGKESGRGGRVVALGHHRRATAHSIKHAATCRLQVFIRAATLRQAVKAPIRVLIETTCRGEYHSVRGSGDTLHQAAHFGDGVGGRVDLINNCAVADKIVIGSC